MNLMNRDYEREKYEHESRKSEQIAGWYHVGFVALYLVAAFWHLRGATEHFRRQNESQNQS